MQSVSSSCVAHRFYTGGCIYLCQQVCDISHDNTAVKCVGCRLLLFSFSKRAQKASNSNISMKIEEAYAWPPAVLEIVCLS